MGGGANDTLPFRHSRIGVCCPLGGFEGALDEGCGGCRLIIRLQDVQICPAWLGSAILDQRKVESKKWKCFLH